MRSKAWGSKVWPRNTSAEPAMSAASNWMPTGVRICRSFIKAELLRTPVRELTSCLLILLI